MGMPIRGATARVHQEFGSKTAGCKADTCVQAERIFFTFPSISFRWAFIEGVDTSNRTDSLAQELCSAMIERKSRVYLADNAPHELMGKLFRDRQNIPW